MMKEFKIISYDQELGVECSHFQSVKQSFTSHTHDYYVIGFIETGKRVFYCDNKKYYLKENDLIIINPSASHYCSPLEHENVLIYKAINIKVETMQNFFALEKSNEIPLFDIAVIYDKELKLKFLTLHEKIMEIGSIHLEPRKRLLGKFLWNLIMHYAKFEVSSTSISKDVAVFLAALDGNYYSNISVKDVCERIGISRGYLFRKFIKEMGITPHRYILTKRLNKALDLLTQGEKSCRVATELGFTDQAHFSKYFKSTMGLTPFEYMRSKRREDQL